MTVVGGMNGCVCICKMSGCEVCTRSVPTLSYDNGEKLISANIVLLQFAFAIYFVYISERENVVRSIQFGSVLFGSVYFVLALISTHAISVHNGKFINVCIFNTYTSHEPHLRLNFLIHSRRSDIKAA